jgi:hypothetical protein
MKSHTNLIEGGNYMKDLTNNKFGKLLVVERVENTKFGKTKWLCHCDCGKKAKVIGGNLTSGTSKSCGCSKNRPTHNFKDLTGKIFGRLTVIKRHGKRANRVKWLCQCWCGEFTHVCSKELLNRDTESCGCLQSERAFISNWKGYGEVSGTYFSSIIHGAKERNISLDITIKQIWNLFLEQNKKCSLTGLDLFLRENHREKTASLDRINSKKGYTIDNVQWVHKNIQLMKNKYSQEEFIKFCKLVADHHK